MREYEDAKWNVQRKHVRILEEYSMEIRKKDSWNRGTRKLSGMLRPTRFDGGMVMVELE